MKIKWEKNEYFHFTNTTIHDERLQTVFNSLLDKEKEIFLKQKKVWMPRIIGVLNQEKRLVKN